MFALYSQLLEQQQNEEKEEDTIQVCTHETILTDHGFTMCKDCGLEITHKIDDDAGKEWKYYGINDTKHSVDPTRCYIRKTKDKTIYQDVNNMNISNHIKDIANNIYVEVCKGKVHRGARRKAIVFASIFHAYKIDNTPQSCENLIKIFKIKRKDALKGLKFINDNASKDSPIRTIYITPEHLINEFLHNFKVSTEKHDEIIELYNFVKDKSATLNRSRPQSVGAGVIWFWIRLNQRQISIKEFIKKVQLSELTVSKMAKEVARLTGNEGII